MGLSLKTKKTMDAIQRELMGKLLDIHWFKTIRKKQLYVEFNNHKKTAVFPMVGF